MRARTAFALVVAVALLAAGCGGSDGDAGDTTTTATETTAATTTTVATTTTAGGTTTTAGGGGMELSIEAEDSEGYVQDRLTVTAGQEVTVTFVNKDTGSGEPHNWHVLTDDGEWATGLSEGPDTQSVTFTVTIPGSYEYWCDTHSEAMRGTLVVSP